MGFVCEEGGPFRKLPTIRIFQNAGLSKEDGFYLEKVVPMLVYRPEGKPMSPGFESVSVQPETEIRNIFL